MYFNQIPQNFGTAQQQDPRGLLRKPVLGYNQGIGGLPQNFGTEVAAPQAPAQPPQAAPQLGNIGGTQTTSGLGGRSITPLMPYDKKFAGQAMAAGGAVGRTLAKGGVVKEGIMALRGEHPDPRSALSAYDEQFGPEATAELMRSYADGGVVSGPGSGVADLIPGTIDGREDVRIASGEYVIPAWAVAALGDGSTEAGAKILDAMVARLREAGSELIKGTDPINPSEFLPA
jgi:hypothetical protein